MCMRFCQTELFGGLDVSAFALSVLFVVCRSCYLEAAVQSVKQSVCACEETKRNSFN